MFSYGSGLASSMFSFVVTSSVKRIQSVNYNYPFIYLYTVYLFQLFEYPDIANKIDLKGRLARRTKVEPEQYVQVCEQ